MEEEGEKDKRKEMQGHDRRCAGGNCAGKDGELIRPVGRESTSIDLVAILAQALMSRRASSHSSSAVSSCYVGAGRCQG